MYAVGKTENLGFGGQKKPKILTNWVFFSRRTFWKIIRELRRREKMNFRRSFPNIRQLKQNPKKSPFFFIHPLGFFQPPCIIMKRLYITICIKQFNNYVNNIKGHQPNSQKCYFIEEHDIFGYHSCQYGYVRYYFFHYHSLKFLIPFRNIFSGEKNNPMRKQRMSKSRNNSIFYWCFRFFFCWIPWIVPFVPCS